MYFLATLGFGFYKRSDKGINSFLFAGRKLTIPSLVATLVSTWYGGILEVGRFTYENGIVTWIIFGFFYYIAALLFVKFIAPKIIVNFFSRASRARQPRPQYRKWIFKLYHFETFQKIDPKNSSIFLDFFTKKYYFWKK